MTEMIDWNRELRAIVREYDGLPPEPSPTEVRAQRKAARRARAEAEQRLAAFGTRARVALVASLLGALYWWPYASCGGGLAALVGAQLMIVIGAVWCAAISWRNRLVASHTVALALLMAGAALVAVQVLPRLGYVSIAGSRAIAWTCG